MTTLVFFIGLLLLALATLGIALFHSIEEPIPVAMNIVLLIMGFLIVRGCFL